MFSWHNNRRLKLRAEPFPAAWLGHLAGNMRHYAHLEPSQRAILQDVVRILAAEKDWSGIPGFNVTDEMKVTVAGQAALLVLGLPQPYYFDRVQSVILHPGAFSDPSRSYRGRITVRQGPSLLGQAWYHSPIILSWQRVLQCGRNAGNGTNVVLHEFAHHLDGLDGDVDGTPPLGREQRETWYRVAEAEYRRLLGSARRGEATVLDHYGATNRAEFFAVITECFFERPAAMQNRHPELYGVREGLLPAGSGPMVARRRRLSGSRRIPPRRRRRIGRRAVAVSQPGRTLHAGVRLFGRRPVRPGRARRVTRHRTRCVPTATRTSNGPWHGFTWASAPTRSATATRRCGSIRAISTPMPRGAAYVGLRQYERAVEDLNRELRANADDADAHFFRGLAWAGLGEFQRAVADYSQSLANRSLAGDVYYQRGLANKKLGRMEDAEADLQTAFQLDPHVNRVLAL